MVGVGEEEGIGRLVREVGLLVAISRSGGVAVC